MGDPKKHRKEYKTPIHPWQKDRIDEEKPLVRAYGLRNKKEIWKMNSLLKNFKAHAKRLVVEQGEQAEKEKENLLKRLYKLGLLEEGLGLPTVLGIRLEDVLERRLQTQLVRRGLARTVKQARQMITHSHVMVNNKKIDAPSYLVSKVEEATIVFAPNSNFFDMEHPERNLEAAAIKAELKKTKATSKKEDKVEKPTTEEKPAEADKEAPAKKSE